MDWLTSQIENIVPAWALFGSSWCAGALVAICLAVPGVVCLAREQIFIGAAVAQASTAGVAVGLALLPFLAGTASHAHVHGARQKAITAVCAIFAAVLAATMTAPGRRQRQGSPESRTGWVFLVSAALSVLLLVNSPHGAHEIARLVASSVLGATAIDAGIFALGALLTLVGAFLARERLVLLAIDPTWAVLADMRRSSWELGLVVWVGIVCGLAIPVSGFLFVFGCLILPAMIARNICRELRQQLWVAPLAALLTTVVGFVIAHQQDWPPAPVVVVLLAALVPLTWFGDVILVRVTKPRKEEPDAS